jgi:peptidyl-tRNA hydrolase
VIVVHGKSTALRRDPLAARRRLRPQRLKSLKANFASPDFWRIRVGVGRPDSTDPERVSGYVLGRFSEPAAEVRTLVEDAARETMRLIERLEAPEEGENSEGTN